MDRIIIIKHPEKIKEIEEYIPLPGQYWYIMNKDNSIQNNNLLDLECVWEL